MEAGLLTIEILTFGFALWLGLYLLARNPAKPLLRLAGLGLIAYALGLAADLLSHYASSEGLTTRLARVHRLLILLPALLWSGALVQLLPEEAALRGRLVRAWSYGLLPVATLWLLLGAGAGLLFDERVGLGPGYLLLALLILAGLVVGWIMVVYFRRAIGPAQPFGLLLAATIFFGLGTGLLILPLNWLPRGVAILSIGLDLVLLDLAIAMLDAFDEGETLLPDISRSFVAALGLALLFGLQVTLVMLAGTGVTFPLLALLLATLAAAITVQSFLDPIQAALDRLAFARAPNLRRARADARAAASILPRVDAGLDLAGLDVAEFARLTRRALSHYGDLPRLASSPLARLPPIAARLAARGAAGDTLDPAAELKALLAASVARLKPRGPDEFGTSDEWRYYNALYFPYIVGLKPYSRRASHDRLNEAAQAALDWFRTSVPERTLYNWQTAAAKLVAQDLREQLERHSEVGDERLELERR